jgi:large subunit ribosomal protein L9
MKVVLLETVKKLGITGEVIEVASGYVRNFLLPSGKVKMATPADIEHSKEIRSKKAKIGVADVAILEILEKLNGKSFSFSKKASKEGKLFGSVSEKDIVEAVEKGESIMIKAEQVQMGHHIKQLGEYEVVVHLGENANAVLKIVVSAA